ncbi:hypothetical protein GCM10028793_58770 [Nocardiopsis oceani]
MTGASLARAGWSAVGGGGGNVSSWCVDGAVDQDGVAATASPGAWYSERGFGGGWALDVLTRGLDLGFLCAAVPKRVSAPDVHPDAGLAWLLVGMLRRTETVLPLPLIEVYGFGGLLDLLACSGSHSLGVGRQP